MNPRWIAGLASIVALSCGEGATDAPSVVRVEVAPSATSLTVGESRSFTARAVDAAGNTLSGALYWSSENTAVATISDAGVVTAIGVGSTRIAASAGGKAAVATVNVSARPVSSVRVTPSSPNIDVGATVSLTASAFDAAGGQVSGAIATWSSANPTIATIDGAGIVTGLAPGIATVSATIGSASGTAVIHVDAVPVASIRLTPSTGSLIEGQTLQLNAEALDAAGHALADRTISWRSSALGVASVSSDGLVVALTPGSATITATADGRSATATISVSPVPVAAVEVSPGTATVSVGNQVQFTALARDARGNVLNRTITWTSDQTSVATVNGSGLATAIVQGTARITASAEGKTVSAVLTINPTPVASVTITPATTSLQTGDTATLRAITKDAAGNILTGRQVTWLSGGPDVTSVSNTGLVTAVGTGSSLIVATSENVSGTSAITVTAPPAVVASIAVTPTGFIMQPNTTRQLSAVVRDASGNILTGRPLIWSTNASHIASVSATGLVTALVDGTVTITASNGSATGSATLSVVTPVASITVAPTTASLLTGDTRQFAAVGRDDTGNILPGRVYTWLSSATSVATVSNSGLVTAVGSGTATISAWTGGISGTATVTVTIPAPIVASVDVSPTSASLKPNDIQALTAVAKDAAGNVIPGQSFAWTSSTTGVATVSASGSVTAVSAGTTTITASTAGVNGTAAITVTPAPVTVASISITPPSANLSTGNVQALTATARDASGNTISGVAFTWTSSATGVATVSSTGSVTAIGAGSATITASSGGVSGTAAIVVTTPTPVVASIGVTPSSANLLTGASQQLSAVAKDASGAVISGQTFTWTSNATSVATVSSSGNVTAIGAGAATITAAIGSITATAAIVVTTPSPVVASISVTPPTASMLTGASQQLTATARDASGATIPGQVFTWTTSAPAVATVSTLGSVSAVAAGSATITAAIGTISGSSAVVVTAPAPVVASIAVTPPSPSVQVGGTQQLTATAKDASGAVITGVTFTWSSSATQVATVSSGGLATAVAAGSATITATNGTITGTTLLTVTPPPVTSVAVTPSGISVMEGQGQQLVATPRDAAGNPIAGKTAKWSTSDASIATVSASGLLSAVQAGQVTISAVIDGITGTSPFTVTPIPVQAVALTPASSTILATQTTTLSATLTGPNGQTLPPTGRAFTWSSSNASVATVSSSGVVTGVAAGSATISLTVEGKVGTASVVVQTPQPSLPAVSSVTFLPNSISMRKGDDVTVIVFVRDVNGRAATGRTCDFSSEDTQYATVSPAQATVGVTGILLPTVSGVKKLKGPSPLTVTAVCGGVSGTLSVDVR